MEELAPGILEGSTHCSPPAEQGKGPEAPSGRRAAFLRSAEYCELSKRLPRNEERMCMVDSLVHATDVLGAFALVLEVEPATERQLAAFHTREFVKALKRPGKLDREELEELGLVDDCPAFEGVFELAALEAGGSLQAAELLSDEECDVAVWWGGGRHHAMADCASGYCYANDCNLAILRLLKSFERVLYVDIDVHHCDAVEDAFSMSDRVLTVSFHHHGPLFFPGTGGLSQVGHKLGVLNVPLHEGCGDRSFVDLFTKIMTDVQHAFRPSVVVLQCGADALTGDPVGVFNLTVESYVHALEFCNGLGVPLLVLGGGGYNPPSVAKCWTLLTHAAAGIPREKWPEVVPGHEFYEDHARDLNFLPPASRRRDCNDADYVEEVSRAAARTLGALGRRLWGDDFVAGTEQESPSRRGDAGATGSEAPRDDVGNVQDVRREVTDGDLATSHSLAEQDRSSHHTSALDAELPTVEGTGAHAQGSESAGTLCTCTPPPSAQADGGECGGESASGAQEARTSPPDEPHKPPAPADSQAGSGKRKREVEDLFEAACASGT